MKNLAIVALCVATCQMAVAKEASQLAKHTDNPQIGVFNKGKAMAGLQLGVVNYANTLSGVQIGVCNIIKSSSVPVLPVVNMSF